MTAPLQSAHLRVARATDNLAKLVQFYRDGLGFAVLGSFEDHAGFDGVLLGHANAGTTSNLLTARVIGQGAHRRLKIFWSFICRIAPNGRLRSIA